MKELPSSRKCPECNGAIELGHTTLVFNLRYRVEIKNVSANVCAQCGEAFVNSYVATEVDRLVNRVIEDVESFARTLAPRKGEAMRKEIVIAV